MIVWGGWAGDYPDYFDTGGRYDPATDTWTATATGGAPPARYDHTAVWTGTEMIVWGGTVNGASADHRRPLRPGDGQLDRHLDRRAHQTRPATTTRRSGPAPR